MSKKQAKTSPRNKPSDKDAEMPDKEPGMGESIEDPDFDSWIEARSLAIRTELGLTSAAEEEIEAQKLYDSDESEFALLDLVGQLGWIEGKLRDYYDSTLLPPDKAKGGILKKYLVKLVKKRNSLQKEFDAIGLEIERRSLLERRDLDPNLNAAAKDREIALLAKICPRFADATPETQRIAWELMLKFSAKQWAYFADLTKILGEKNKVERAERLKEICGKSNLRNLFGRQPSPADKAQVNDVMTLLLADKIKTKNA